MPKYVGINLYRLVLSLLEANCSNAEGCNSNESYYEEDSVVAGVGVGGLSGLAGSGKNNSLEVGILGAELIKPSVTAILAVPVLDVTVLGSGRSNSCYVLNVVNDGKYYCEEVGLNAAVYFNGAANGAEIVCDVTGLEAGSCLSVVMLPSVSSRSLNGEEVRNKSSCLVEPSVTAVLAVPVLNIALCLAGSCLSCYVLDLVLGGGELNSENVGCNAACNFYPITCRAVPILDITHLEAIRSLSLYVYESVSSTELNGLEVGNESSCLVEPCVTANGAVPVLNVTVSLASRSNSCYVLDGVVKSGKLNSEDVGCNAACNFDPVAVLACPVLDVTELKAGCFLSLKVLKIVSSRKDAAETSSVVLTLCVGEVAIAASAIPVSDVTFGLAGGSNSLGLYELVLVGRLLVLLGAASALTHLNAGFVNGSPSGPVVNAITVQSAVGSCGCDNNHSGYTENECKENSCKLSHDFSPFLDMKVFREYYTTSAFASQGFSQILSLYFFFFKKNFIPNC